MTLVGISIVSLEEPAVQRLHLQKKLVCSSRSDFSLFPSLSMMFPCLGTSFSQSYVLMQFWQLQVFHQSHSFLLFLCVSCPRLPESILSPCCLFLQLSFPSLQLSVGSSAWPANWHLVLLIVFSLPESPLCFFSQLPNICQGHQVCVIFFIFLAFIPSLLVLEIEPRASCIAGKTLPPRKSLSPWSLLEHNSSRYF